MKKYFERRVVASPRRLQVWWKSGGEFEKGVDVDDFREQYGPYAR